MLFQIPRLPFAQCSGLHAMVCAGCLLLAVCASTTEANNDVRLKGILRVDSVSWALLSNGGSGGAQMLSTGQSFAGGHYQLEQLEVTQKRVQIRDLVSGERFWLTLDQPSSSSEDSTLFVDVDLDEGVADASTQSNRQTNEPVLKPFSSLPKEVQSKLYHPKFVPMLEASGIKVPSNLRSMAEHEQEMAARNAELHSLANAGVRVEREVISTVPLRSNAKTAEELAAMKGER
ncbi:hypothetical protein [Cerasicoccus maritimus]|uniref:hypothetical protein n=1 Tax=Cerasicoccus maritimus TaxID=490089 RepID=UPI0028524DFE|nr:hypothetical protein [Cerasicoccus maritimus]